LCGGTHLENTAQIGLLTIVSEESVAAGTRRVVALTGRKAMDRIRGHEQLLHQASVALRLSPEELPARVEAMAQELRDLRKKLASVAPPSESVSVEQLAESATSIAGVRVVAAEVPGAGPDALRHLIDQLRRKAAPVVALLASHEEGKVTLIAGASREVVDGGFDCVTWVRAVAKRVGGGGGGRPDMAQAGGKTPETLPEAIQSAPQEAQRLLGQMSNES
ncbi:MAG: DHHA1 domain-containing protein, partial [Patescibacteria group bacterium]|nr:DHHA1 domain-containing protein [Patescibacteria group bacterium]